MTGLLILWDDVRRVPSLRDGSMHLLALCGYGAGYISRMHKIPNGTSKRIYIKIYSY